MVVFDSNDVGNIDDTFLAKRSEKKPGYKGVNVSAAIEIKAIIEGRGDSTDYYENDIKNWKQ